MVHTPHREKFKGTRRIIDICKDVGMNPDLCLIDHNNEETVRKQPSRGFSQNIMNVIFKVVPKEQS